MSLAHLITSPWKVPFATPNEVMQFCNRKISINQPDITLGQFGLKVGTSLQDFSRYTPVERLTFSVLSPVISNHLCLVATTYLFFLPEFSPPPYLHSITPVPSLQA